MPAICPACRTVLAPEASSCPICLRPRSREEMMRSFAQVKKTQLRRRRIPFFVTGALALAGLAAWQGPSAYRKVAPAVRSQAASAVKRAQDALDRAESPESYETGPAKAPPPSAPALPAPQAQLATPAPSPAPAPTPETSQPPPRWEISGRVYELLSLKPVAGARLAFAAPDGAVTRATADAAGRYAVSLAPLSEDGYALTINRGGARADYLEEVFTPFTQQDAARREEQARETAKTRVLHVPITVDESRKLVYNVALLPARRK